MKPKRKVFSSAFKAKVTLAAVSSHHTLAELARLHSIHPTQIAKWELQLLKNADELL